MDLCKIITYTVPNYPQNSSQLPNYPQNSSQLPNYPELPKFTHLPTINQYYSRILFCLSKLIIIPRTTHFVQGITQNNYSYFYSKFYFGETIPVILILSVDVRPGGEVKLFSVKALWNTRGIKLVRFKGTKNTNCCLKINTIPGGMNCSLKN